MLQTAWIIMEAADRFRLPQSDAECVQSILRAPFLLIAIVEANSPIDRHPAHEPRMEKLLWLAAHFPDPRVR
jgi:hypothetical protein